MKKFPLQMMVPTTVYEVVFWSLENLVRVSDPSKVIRKTE